jgi:hypothetical protein
MNKEEYIRYRMGSELNELLNPEQQKEFKEFKKAIKDDKNKLRYYAWFRSDVLTEFVATINNKQKQEFIKRQKELRSQFEKDFEKETSMIDQLEVGDDGMLSFKDNSILSELRNSVNADGVSQATQLLGDFSHRVREINNKIHGVYNRYGSAYIEKMWFGSLVMQFHKHFPMGLLKRYRSRGYYNEARGSVEKGMLHSIVDFMTLNAQQVTGMSREEIETFNGLKNVFKSTLNFMSPTLWKTTWNLMPEYERANIRRNLGDLVAVLGSVLLTIGLLGLGGDDDESVPYNLALYELDRLGSEGFMYNPIGLTTELKTLSSTPIAGQSIITDLGKTLMEISGFVLEGEDYDGIYKSGKFAGKNKLSVFVQRRIPMWNGIRQIIDTPANNKAYKIGSHVSTLFNTGEAGEWLYDELH